MTQTLVHDRKIWAGGSLPVRTPRFGSWEILMRSVLEQVMYDKVKKEIQSNLAEDMGLM